MELVDPSVGAARAAEAVSLGIRRVGVVDPNGASLGRKPRHFGILSPGPRWALIGVGLSCVRYPVPDSS